MLEDSACDWECDSKLLFIDIAIGIIILSITENNFLEWNILPQFGYFSYAYLAAQQLNQVRFLITYNYYITI